MTKMSQLKLTEMFQRKKTSSNCLFFYDFLIIFVRGKTDHHINLAHFLKKRCLLAFSVLKLIVFY